MANIRYFKALLAVSVLFFCSILILPQESRALAEGLTVTVLREHTLKDALSDVRYLTKKGYVKISALTIITEPGAALSVGDFSFIAGSLSELAALDISAAALEAGVPPTALRGCEKLQSVLLPSALVSIGSRAFEGCTRLQDIILPEGLISIGERAFAGCASLKEIHIPESVTLIGAEAFRGCKGLENISVHAENTGYQSDSGVLYTRDGIELHPSPAGKTGAYSVLPGTRVIPPYAFADCGANLTGITLPVGLDTIGEYAFAGCTRLSDVKIPEGVGSIDYAFRGCASLESVSLPKSMYFIGWESFSGCKKLKSVTFQGPVERIGPLAFEGCSSLTDVRFSSYFPTSKIRSDAFKGCSNLKAVHVPAGTSGSFNRQLRGKIGKARIVEV